MSRIASMVQRSKWSWQRRAGAFGHALRGVGVLLRTQPHAWIHAGATAGVVAAGVVLEVSRADWLWLVLAIAIVWIAEGLNASLELLCDAVHPEPGPLIRDAKDVAAGAVLLAAIGAAIIGILVLLPYLDR